MPHSTTVSSFGRYRHNKYLLICLIKFLDDAIKLRSRRLTTKVCGMTTDLKQFVERYVYSDIREMLQCVEKKG
jgi:hypothetical protein